MRTSPRIHSYAPGLYLIALAPPLTGFGDFMGIWFFEGPPRVLVDVGPAATTPQLLAALEEIGTKRIDYILLTHVHIDHAGGLAAIAAAFPQAPVVAHSRGRPHLADPARLWAGSLKTLGKTAEAYGPIAAVPAERLALAEDLIDSRIEAIYTPGHASHHVSYRLDDLLFAGEAGGVCLAVEGAQDFLRPATPPRFRLQTALSSLDALIALDLGKICYSHFGLRADARGQLRAHRDQLLLWQQIVAEETPQHPKGQAEKACLQRLMREDHRLASFRHLPAGVRQREEGFLRNSLRGFMGEFEEKQARASEAE
ncbi:MAG: MBL fold metallo-hydrolase [Desulfobacterales bacterium]|nr:MBL fold metallo-hydrolase [Desulfobacterales bacterium]